MRPQVGRSQPPAYVTKRTHARVKTPAREVEGSLQSATKAAAWELTSLCVNSQQGKFAYSRSNSHAVARSSGQFPSAMLSWTGLRREIASAVFP